MLLAELILRTLPEIPLINPEILVEALALCQTGLGLLDHLGKRLELPLGQLLQGSDLLSLLLHDSLKLLNGLLQFFLTGSYGGGHG